MTELARLIAEREPDPDALERERWPMLTGSETLYAAIGELVQSGRDRHPQAGICRGCSRTTKAGARYCRKHDVVSAA